MDDAIAGSGDYGPGVARTPPPDPRPVVSVTVMIPTIPPRKEFLARALRSVGAQTVRPAAVLVREDTKLEGPAAVRTAMLAEVATEWVAFCDDDDYWHLTSHLEDLLAHAAQTGADYVFSYFNLALEDGFTDNTRDDLNFFGRPFDPANPHQTTSTILVRADLAKRVGFRTPPVGLKTPDGHRWGEDYQFVVDCVAAGARVSHLAKRTWTYHWHGANTSGEPSRWS